MDVAVRLLICGGRNYSGLVLMHNSIYQVCRLMNQRVSLIIHGDATGADTLAQVWADFQGIPTLPFPAKWTVIDGPGVRLRWGRHGWYNAAAGTDRNQRMLDEGKPDAWLAMPGGVGTADMVRRCKAAGLRGIQVE